MRRYTATGVIRRYEVATTAPESSPRRPAAPLKWLHRAVAAIRWVGRGGVSAVRIVLRLALDETATSSRTQRAITDASIRNNMPVHLLPGYGPPELH